MKHQFTYKYRLYPTEKQQTLLAKHFGHTRFLYNEFLRNRIDAYQERKETLNYYDNQGDSQVSSSVRPAKISGRLS